MQAYSSNLYVTHELYCSNWQFHLISREFRDKTIEIGFENFQGHILNFRYRKKFQIPNSELFAVAKI